MKITAIQTSNVLGARAIDVRLTKPVTLFAGKNGAGKSSLQEAIRMAMTGESVRVGLKKDYGALVTDGQESGLVEVETADASYSVVLPSGKGIHCDAKELPFVLDAQRFARMDDKERRAFLFGLMGLRTDGAAVKERLVARGCDAAKVEQIAPFLRAGFDAAQKEAAANAREAKSCWKTVTGGETWGKDKAPKWQPAQLPADADRATALLENARAQMAEVEKQLGAAQQELGAAKSEQQRRQQAAAQRDELADQAGKIDRIKSKLAHDEVELKEWEQRVAEAQAAAGKPVSGGVMNDALLRGFASVTNEMIGIVDSTDGVVETDTGELRAWQEFEGLINRMRCNLSGYTKQHGALIEPSEGNPEVAAKLPDYEKALHLLQSAVANGKRDLGAAEHAAAKLAELDKDATQPVDLEAMQGSVKELTEKRDGWRADADKYRAMAEQTARRQAVIDQAAALHADVLAWTDIADALAPDGIPGDILAEALGPINDRLHVSAGFAEWEPVAIQSDMQITYGGRDYALISESEKWRTDAMIAEAVSFLAGVKLLVLDRFDVLDLKGREDLLYWLDGMAEDGDIETALLFGTLKALPAKLPERIGAHWIENGTAGQMKEAA